MFHPLSILFFILAIVSFVFGSMFAALEAEFGREFNFFKVLRFCATLLALATFFWGINYAITGNYELFY
jgi:hypothetical protein